MKNPFRREAPAPDERYEALEAEYRNYRRRTAEELQKSESAACRKAVLQLLPLYDDLETALRHECRDEAYRRGIEMVMANLVKSLENLKVRPMDSLGKCFNPDYHEAVGHVEDPQYRQEEIIEIVRTGFTMDDEVIRHAKVVVAN
jgi:molecular chaperone GrpE